MACILVVDDEPNIRLLVSSVLRQLGHKTLNAENGLVGLLTLAQNSDVNVIVTDIRMPELGGISFSEEVKRQYPHIPIIVISAYPDDAIEALGHGADRYLPKPFSRNQLVEAVTPYLNGI